MANLIHFFTLVGEYSLIPIAIFIFSFIPKIRNENAKIINYGFELVLIEALGHLAVVLRLLSDEQSLTNSILAFFSFLAFLFLGAIFIIFLMRYGNLHVENEKVFYLTFYSAFLGWWLKVLILLFYSHLADFISIYCLILCFVTTFEAMKYVIRKYYITWHTLGTKVNDLINQGKTDAAEKQALKILEAISSKEGYENGDLIGQITLSLAKCYYESDNKVKLANGICLLQSLIENKNYKGEKSMVGMRLAAIYLKLDKKNEAVETLRKYLPHNKAEDRIKEITDKGNLNSYYNIKK